MGEELELGQMYFMGPDGKKIPWNGLEAVEATTDNSEMNDDICPVAHWPEELNMTLELDRKKNKKFFKWLKHLNNILDRRKRYYYRQKERARRRKLKGAKYV